MSQETELLPCPFCGEKPIERLDTQTFGAAVEWFHVFCGSPDCPVSTVELKSPRSQKEVWAAWNKRAPDLRAIDDLEMEVKSIQLPLYPPVRLYEKLLDIIEAIRSKYAEGK